MMRLLRVDCLLWGRCPHTPGIYRFTARMTALRGGRYRLGLFRLLSRRSGCVPAEPYPPLRSFQSGIVQRRRAMNLHRTANTPLTSCLTPGVHFKLPLVPFPFAPPNRFSSSIPKPALDSRHLYPEHSIASNQVSAILIPESGVLRF